MRAVAERPGEQTRPGQLAVFIGAGVSAAAGLPTWERLVARAGEAAAAGLRLGHGGSAGSGDGPPPDGSTDTGDERLQEQRPG